MIDFGELRSAVEVALQEPQRVDHVVWILLHAPSKGQREEWAVYASNKLASVTRDHVNLGELVSWLVDGAPQLAAWLASRGFAMPDEKLLVKFLAGMGWSILTRPERAPFIFVSSEQDSSVYLSGYSGNTWCLRVSEEGGALHALDITLGSTEWTGVGEHLELASVGVPTLAD